QGVAPTKPSRNRGSSVTLAADRHSMRLSGATNAYRFVNRELDLCRFDDAASVRCRVARQSHRIQEPLRGRHHCRSPVCRRLRGLELLSPQLWTSDYQDNRNGRTTGLVDVYADPAMRSRASPEETERT